MKRDWETIDVRTLHFKNLDLELVKALSELKKRILLQKISKKSLNSEIKPFVTNLESRNESKSVICYLDDIRSKYQNCRSVAISKLRSLSNPKFMLKQIPRFKKNIHSVSARANMIIRKSNYITYSSEKTKEVFEALLYVSIKQRDEPGSTYETISFLGCQMLTEMLNQIPCLKHKLYNNHASLKTPTYLWVEDYLFIDTRKIKEDIKKTIKKILKKLKDDNVFYLHNVSDGLKWKAMETTRFKDINVRIGSSPWGLLYHWKECEHFVNISYLRMLHKQDYPTLQSSYPLIIHRIEIPMRKCYVCLTKYANRILFYDKEALENPSDLCEDCYRRLHYDQDGTSLFNDYLVFPGL
jgi:hypothetical protein